MVSSKTISAVKLANSDRTGQFSATAQASTKMTLRKVSAAVADLSRSTQEIVVFSADAGLGSYAFLMVSSLS